MSALDSLKEFIEQRLAAAVEEIFEYFEKTVTKYEQELDRYREVLDMMLLPEIRLRREDVHSLTDRAGMPSGHQEIQSSLQQQFPQPPHIKEEQDGEQLHMLTEFPLISVTVKSEDDEEKIQLPQLHQSQSEENTDADPPENPAADAKDYGGSEPEFKEKHDFSRFSGGKMCEPFTCLFCERCFCSKSELAKHERGHKKKKPYCTSLQQNSRRKSHARDHTGEKPFRCSNCGECFSHHTHLKHHMMCHKAEKAFSGRKFTQKSQIETCEGVCNS